MVFASAILAASPAQARDPAERIDQPVQESIEIRQATQSREEQWRLEREKLISRFEQLQQEQTALQQQKAQLQQQLESARARIASKEVQLQDIEEVAEQMQPFLEEVAAELLSHLAAGLPFLMDERKGRIEKLMRLLGDPDLPISEKYRKTMEALWVEAEYGFSVEATRETISLEDGQRFADVLRLGRLALFYLSLDGSHCGSFHVTTGGWKSLPPSACREIHPAIEIARKRRPAEILSLPVGRLVPR
jgi:small-conductance mechanosensitive channel